MKLNWKFGIFAGIVLAALSIYPQARLVFHLRGEQNWNGNFAITDVDEVMYAAYLQALIEGKPRKNDPYTKLEESNETRLAESPYSLNFVPPYFIAIPARALQLSAPSAMTIAGAFAAFSTGLALFWLVGSVSRSTRIAMTGALVVVCFGAFTNAEGGILHALGLPTGLLFPAFRRYVPAIPLVFFFIFCGTLWHFLEARENIRKRVIYGAFASICFWLMVFSYLYIWTAAAAVLGCVVISLTIVRPEDLAKQVKALLLLGFTCSLSLIPYGILLAHRSTTSDGVMLLVHTHSPNLGRMPELIGFGVILILVLGVIVRKVPLKEHSTVFVGALAMVPFVLFNQQIITGRELQPFHYGSFIGNYIVLTALFLACVSMISSIVSHRSRLRKIAIWSLSIIAICWGTLEVHYATRFYDSLNILRDRKLAVAWRLKEIGDSERRPYGTVLSYHEQVGDDLSGNIPQPVLWAWHQIVFGSVQWQESKERYYQYLYYKDCDRDMLAGYLREGEGFSVVALFGVGRLLPNLVSDFHQLTDLEIEEEADLYETYVQNFSPTESSDTILSFVIVPNKDKDSLKMANVDKWYDRDAGEEFDGYTLYRVRLRTPRF